MTMAHEITTEQPRMASRRVGALLLLFQGPEEPTNDEWGDVLHLLRSFGKGLAEARVLVLTQGGGPTPYQRKLLSEVLGKAPIRVAVVTTSVKVRFITSSVALFIPRIRSFAWDRLADAYGHLSLTPQERQSVAINVDAMQQIVGTGSLPLSIPAM